MQTSADTNRLSLPANSSRRRVLRWSVALVLAVFGVAPTSAAEFELTLKGSYQNRTVPLAEAVVSLQEEGHPESAPPGTRAVIDQRNATFVPSILAVQTGTAVYFPNSDNTLHHVYSFSPAKRFELPLYSGHLANPVVFDRPGIATLGCNIHDWMVAHVVVLDTPYFAVTDANGVARIEAPPGDYLLKVWHAREAEPMAAAALQLSASGTKRTIKLQLAPPPPPRTNGSDRLRALQRRLRNNR